MSLLTYKVERLTSLENDGCRTLFFLIRCGTRRRPITFFDPDKVPPFEGPFAYFEIDRTRGRWTFIRQVEAPR